MLPTLSPVALSAAPWQAPASAEAFPAGWGDPAQVVAMDMNDPESAGCLSFLRRTVAAMADLPPGGTLLVRHGHRPFFLYPRLEELGYQHRTREPKPGSIEILIHKPERR